MQSSSVNSTCVDVSHPFENGTVDKSHTSPPATKLLQISDDGDDEEDGKEVDLAQLNMMDILHAESPQHSLLAPCDCSDTPTGTSKTAPPQCSEDDVAHLAAENADSCNSSPSSHSWTGRSPPQSGVGEERSTINTLEPQHTTYEVYTMSFGGVHCYYCGNPAPSMHNDHMTSDDKLELLSQQGQSEVQPTGTTSTGALEDHNTGSHYEAYNVSFGGVYTFSSAVSSNVGERKGLPVETEDRLEQQEVELSTSPLRRDDSEAASHLPAADKESNDDANATKALECNKKTVSEIYEMKFDGLYTFSTAESPRADSCDNEVPEVQKCQEKEECSGKERKLPTSDEKTNVSGLRDDEKRSSQHETQNANVSYELFTVSFGGVHTFTSTPSPASHEKKPLGCDDSAPTSTVERPSSLQRQDKGQERAADMMVPKHVDEKTTTSRGQITSTPYEVHTVTYRGLHTFTASCSDIVMAETMVM